ncbi:MAG: 2-hydroxyhepta-2,4-diene-1,7-dioate isomerase, partial [Ancylobacter novellus]
MKLVRYGQPGAERPAILDAQGVLRDLSSIVSDIAGAALLPENLARIRAVDPAVLPAVEGTPRIGACVGQVGKFVCVGLNYTDHA